MNIKGLLTLVITGLTYLGQAQIQMYIPKQVKLANIEYRNENYASSADLCAKAFAKIERKGGKAALRMKGDMAYKTAESFRQIENTRDAHEWYDKAIILRHYEQEPMVYFYNAEMLRSMGEFKKAIDNYNKYKELAPEDKRADVGIRSCEIHQDFKINKTRHVVSNVAALNKDVFEMAPMLSDKKGTSMYFSTTREGGVSNTTDPRSGENYMDLWVTEKDKKDNWGQPKLVAGELINTEDNEGTVCFDGRGKKMFFTRCPTEDKLNLGCDIWMSDLKGKEWGEPTKLALKGHDSISVGHPCVTEDGNYLIFASDMPGGFGGRDLYYTTYTKKTDTWEAPINLGETFNTAGNELFPTFALNGDLFFATDGMPGMGGLDIFRASKVKDKTNKWENPKNVGFPLNSVSNDYALIEVAEKKGYFTSERVGSVGKALRPDIWMYEMPPNLFTLKVNIVELLNNKERIAGAKVTVKATEGANGNITWEGTTKEDGSVYWDKKPDASRYVNENMSYSVSVEKEKYKSVKEASFTTVNVFYDQDFVIELPMLKEEPIRLPEVRYPLNQWTFVVDSTINSLDSLNFVYDLLMKYPTMKLELSSHTDARSGNIYNQVLSENRAKACVKYLVEEKGIDAKRLVPVGKGESTPKTMWLLVDGSYSSSAPLDTAGAKLMPLKEAYINGFKAKDKKKFEMLHQLNRRTEGFVLDMQFDPALAPAVSEDYFKFKPLPKNTRK
ncbi:MAG: OmpA family protein [Bacteroidota bacterium]